MADDPLWINASGGAPSYTSRELRRAFAMFLTQAVADRFGARQGVHPGGANAVTISAFTITVQHTKAVVYPGLNSLAGPYVVQLQSGTHTVTTNDPANPRKDIIVLRVYDDDEDVSGQRKAESQYIAGTPAPSPSEPAVPSGAFRLATIDTPAGSGNPTLTYNAPFTVASGGILPVRSDSELTGGSGGLYDGMARWNQALNELQVHNGSATWETIASVDGHSRGLNPPSCRVFDTGAQTLNHNTLTVVTFGSERYDASGMHSVATNTGRITFATAGVYSVGCCIQFSAGADYSRSYVGIRRNGTTEIARQDIRVANQSAAILNVAVEHKFAANDYVEVVALQTNGASAGRSTIATSELSPEFWATYLGSGS